MDEQTPQNAASQPESTPATTSSTSHGQGGHTGGHGGKSDAEEHKWYGVISYVWILCLIPLFAVKKSPFAQHHAKQGLVLLLTSIVVNIASWYLPYMLASTVSSLGGLAIFILAVMGIINAWQGKMWEMPVLGDLAKKLKF